MYCIVLKFLELLPHERILESKLQHLRISLQNLQDECRQFRHLPIFDEITTELSSGSNAIEGLLKELASVHMPEFDFDVYEKWYDVVCTLLL